MGGCDVVGLAHAFGTPLFIDDEAALRPQCRAYIAAVTACSVGAIKEIPGVRTYGYAMADNYNGQPRPAVALVRDGGAREIIARETWDDVPRLQRPRHQ